MAFGSRDEACYVTRLVLLRALPPRQQAQCEALRREAGRCWSELVTLHRERREQGAWLSTRDLELYAANRFALHSQTLQALAQRLDANLQTGRALREQEATTGDVRTQLPYKTPEFQTVTWKDMAIAVDAGGRIQLSNGRGRPALTLPLPPEYQRAEIRRAELLWRADHYEVCLTFDTTEVLPEPCAEGATAGVDLGEVHIAGVVTNGGESLVVSGRGLRSCKRLRNKRHAAYRRLLARCAPGSRRRQRLRRRRAQASAKLFRQQRDILHQASRKVVAFCQQEGVGRIAVGDVRDIQTGVRMGKNNQKIAQWPHGQFFQYLSYKADRKGMRAAYIAEDYSTVTCSVDGHRNVHSPRKRMLTCKKCGRRHHRDVNGAANICSRAVCGTYGSVQYKQVTFVRPISRRIMCAVNSRPRAGGARLAIPRGAPQRLPAQPPRDA